MITELLSGGGAGGGGGLSLDAGGFLAVPTLQAGLSATLAGSCITRDNPGNPIIQNTGSGTGQGGVGAGGCKDPFLYYEAGTYVVCYSAVGTNGGLWRVGMAQGPSLQSLTNSFAVDTQTDPNTTGAGTPSGSGGAIIKVPGSSPGPYHLFFSATDSWNPITKGQVFHYTAAAPVGPWTFSDIALPHAAGAIKLDNSQPMLINGTWWMLYSEYTGVGFARAMKWATASSIYGPWTASQAITYEAAANQLTDNPGMLQIGNRSWATGGQASGVLYLYDATNPPKLVMDGPAMINYGPGEGNNIRASGFVMPDGTIKAVYMGSGGTYGFAIYAGTWGAHRQIGQAPKSGNFTSYFNLTNSQTGVAAWNPANPGSGDNVPPCTYAASIMCRITETVTFTPGEGVRLDPNFAGEAYPSALNVPASVSAWVPVPGSGQINFDKIGTWTNVTVAWNPGICAFLPV